MLGIAQKATNLLLPRTRVAVVPDDLILLDNGAAFDENRNALDYLWFQQIVREAGRGILEMLGYRALLAANGCDALEMYRSAECIDLVITDLVMPEMGGGVLVQALKEHDPQVRVLAITGYAVTEDLERLREAGILNVIQKPLDASTLSKAIRLALDAC